MRHRELEELLTPYLLGDATPEESEKVRGHLGNCESCRALAQELELTLDLLRDALAAEAPAAPVRLSVEHRDAVYRSRPPGWILWISDHRRGLGYAAAAALIMALLGGMLAAMGRPVRTAWLRQDRMDMARLSEASEHQVEERIVDLHAPATPVPTTQPGGPASAPLQSRLRGIGRIENHVTQDRRVERESLGLDRRELADSDGESVYADDGYAEGDVLRRKDPPASRFIGGDPIAFGVLAESGEYDEEVAPGKVTSDVHAWFGEDGIVNDPNAVRYKAAGRVPRMAGQALALEKTAKSVERSEAVTDFSTSSGMSGERPDLDSDDVGKTQWAAPARRNLDLLSQVHVAEGREIRAGGIPSTEASEPAPAKGDVSTLGILFDLGEERKAKESLNERPIFRGYGVNPYRVAAQQPISTFGIDVDTASYTLARRYIDNGSRPPPDAVRTEEFVNFFDDDHRPPVARTFAIHATGAPAPFGEGMLVKIGVKGKHLGRDDQKPSVLTFVIDTSGSMDTQDRLGLVKTSLGLLLGELDPADQVAIVQVDSEARLVLEHTPVGRPHAIQAAIAGLQCSGSTHLAAGIELGYEVAVAGFTGGAVNRVLILSDGAANLGSANPEEILDRVEAGRKQGIVSSVFGFGLGTYNDAMLETLANRGDGAYRFIDSKNEAQRVFVDELSAALNVIARDVKIQVEFDPARVAHYRQLGYENRQLNTEDFRDDAVDAGEVGSGQSVTALYEVILTKETRGRLGMVRVRYRDERTGRIEETSRELRAGDLVASFEQADAHFRLAACAAEFAELLRNSPFAADGAFDAVAAELRPITMELHLDQRVRELLGLVQRAGRLPSHTPDP